MPKVEGPTTHIARVSNVAELATLVIAIGALAGWLSGSTILASFLPDKTPMNPITAVALLLSAIAVICLRAGGDTRLSLVRGCSFCVFVLPLLSLSRLYLPWDLGPDRLLFARRLAVPVAGFTNRMAPVTACALVFIAVALFLLTFESARARRVGSAAAMIVGVVGLAVIVDYGYESRSLSTIGGFIPVAFNTGLALLACSIGLLAARPTEGVMLLVRNGAGSVLARRLLPAAVIIPITISWLELRGTDFGWYDNAGGSALVAMTTMLLLVALVWRDALRANRADDERTGAESKLREVNHSLEARVALRTGALVQTNAELSVEVAARRRAEEELRRTADELRGWFEASPLAMCSLSAGDIVLSWNRAAEGLFGWQANEVIGKSLPIVSDASRAEAAELTAQVIAGKPVMDYETQRLCRDGSVREVSVSTAALHDAAGKARGVVALYTDIGHRKQLERQLHQAQKMDAIGQLAGGVAHDFNNILTVIQAAAEFLASELDEHDTRRADALEIESAALRAAKLTRQLLTFSRQSVVERQPLDLAGVVDRTDSMLRRLLEANVELLIHHQAGQGLVNADPHQLEQIIVNLVVNARDAMPRGGRILIETQSAVLDDNYARAHVGTIPGPYVMLAVTDTGTGMSLDTQARVFEPFFTTKAAGEGTGLGLATVYGIVKQFNGHIWLYSELGSGTTFKIYLPEMSEPGAVDAAVTGAGPVAATRGTRVLLVEDHAIVRRAVHAQLERQGYLVTDAESGDEALAVLHGGDDGFDLVLSDMMMPGLSGLELRHRLQDQGSTLPVLLMSGYSENAIKRFGSIDQLSPHIEKPFTTALLTRRIEELVGARGDG